MRIVASEYAAEQYGLALDHKNALLRLPSGDHIMVPEIVSIRCSDMKTDRRTGEIGAPVYILASGSWFTVRFGTAEEAKRFSDALATLRNMMLRPNVRVVSREAAADMVADLQGRAAHHAGPEDFGEDPAP